MNRSIDRISGLPDEVLTHILSFMRTKKAVQTCILSKRWRNVWKSVPVLYFYLNDFWEKKGKWDDDGDGDVDGEGVGDEDEDEDEDEEWVISEHKFARFVDGVLDNRGPSHVDKVIYVWKYETHEAVLSPYDYDPSVEWLDRVVPLMPRVIIVYIERAYTLCLPDSVFSCASLEIFRMSLYSEDRAFVAPKSINLPSLKILELLCLELSDNFARKLFSGCPVLESVTFGSCGLDISVISSDSLKKLDIEDCRQYRPLHISCLALVSLSIDNFYQGQSISLENLVSLVNLYIRILARDTDEYLPLPTLKLLSGLSNATSIKLYIPCPELKKQLEMDIPNCKIFNNLKSLDIGRWDRINSIDLVVFFLKNSPNLQELTLQLRSCQDIDEVPGQEGVGDDDLFQLESLETLKIICARKECADNLVNLLGRYIKAIGNIIVDSN